MSDHSNIRNMITAITGGRQVKQKEPTETTVQGGGSVSRKTSRKKNPRKNLSEEKGTKWMKMDQTTRIDPQTGNIDRYFEDGRKTVDHLSLWPGRVQ
jgi:hypothetical protein